MHIEQVKLLLKEFPLEAFMWLSGLVALTCFNPSHDTHVTLCPLASLGFDFCPGCGLGRSISWLLHGSLENSLRAHPLGIITFGLLAHRIVNLGNNYLKRIWQK